MTDMQPGSARIRKHVEDVKLRFRRIESLFSGIWSVKGVLLFPDALPFRLELVEWKGFAALVHTVTKQESSKAAKRKQETAGP
jgi:hypothetical protein